jgi:TetR/AcrR family transcriptional regulator, cholesterol catabolism regulator
VATEQPDLPPIALPRRSRQVRRAPTAAHQDKLEEIKRQAARHFYSDGYAATDLRRIADAARMHVSTLYNYISGKEQLLYLIMKEGMLQISAGLEEAVADRADPRDRVRAAIVGHVVHHARRQHLAWTSHVEVHALTGDYLEEILSLRRGYEQRWMAILQDGVRAGLFVDADPRLVMLGILAMGQSVARWYRPGSGYAPEQVAHSMADLALVGVLRREPRPGE